MSPATDYLPPLQIGDYKELQRRVQNGWDFLNKNFPGWQQMIDLDALDLKECSKCILGQRFGDYILAFDEKEIDAPFLESATWSRDHGFTLDGVEAPEIFNDLTHEWKRVISNFRSESPK